MNILSDNNAVQIAVRERPAREHLKNNLQSSVISYHPNGKNIIVNETVFTFDLALDPSATQKEIFDRLIKPLVVKLKLGFNCTALAYGQTGTGKSYTMGLNFKSFDGDDVGVIPRCLKEIFSMIEENRENSDNVNSFSQKVEISSSFIEIYNEKVYDLLGENTNAPIIAKGYKYTGGTRKLLNNLYDCQAILMQGNKNRHVRPTKMNSQSSRSHAIFTIHVHSSTQKVNGEESVTKSCMNFVDLAGSEGVRRTGHQGMAMSEGVYINQGLLSIGKVLQAMTTGSKVIPYRDSVLSFVLQESLNTNSYLTLLACVSPHREDISETLSTLRFAQNAKHLKNTPEINNLIADIKKNSTKLKQTPYKVKPMQVNNARATPLKRSYSTLYGTQAKSSVKSHTFCTPKKQRVEINKCNQTEISSNYIRSKLSNIAMNLPEMGQLESTHNRESIFNRSLDSNGSLLSLNISTSTAVDGHAHKRNANFSPIVRKCVEELKKDLEDSLMQMLQKNLRNLVPQTTAPIPQNQTALPSNIRQELKNIMKEVLLEKNALASNVEEALQTNAKSQLFNDNDTLFKIPEVPPEVHRPKTSSPINNAQDSSRPSTSFSKTFFAGATNSEETVLIKSIRRSYRIFANQQRDQSTCSTDTTLTHPNQSLRRSSRISVLKMYQNKHRSILSATHNETHLDEINKEKVKTSKTVKKSNKTSKASITNNTIIDGYCNGTTTTNAKTSLTQHRKAILDLLNKGSIKELQILPQVGQKTAYQIVTQRTLNGKFKSLAQIQKLPIWRGNAWERFAQANMLI